MRDIFENVKKLTSEGELSQCERDSQVRRRLLSALVRCLTLLKCKKSESFCSCSGIIVIVDIIFVLII
jgi:hypothetical protein